jgi:hypothetical protein
MMPNEALDMLAIVSVVWLAMIGLVVWLYYTAPEMDEFGTHIINPLRYRQTQKSFATASALLQLALIAFAILVVGVTIGVATEWIDLSPDSLDPAF